MCGSEEQRRYPAIALRLNIEIVVTIQVRWKPFFATANTEDTETSAFEFLCDLCVLCGK